MEETDWCCKDWTQWETLVKQFQQQHELKNYWNKITTATATLHWREYGKLKFISRNSSQCRTWLLIPPYEHCITAGARRCDRTIPSLQELHWLPVRQRVVSRRPWWSGSVSTLLLLPTAATSAHLLRPQLIDRSALCFKSNLTGSTPLYCNGLATFRCQSNYHLVQSAVCTTNTRAAVRERFHTRALRHTCSHTPGIVETFYAIPVPSINTLTYLLTYWSETADGACLTLLPD